MDLLDPDSPFMRGYNREPVTAERLVNAVREAVYAHPQQRLGQIIVNAMRDSNIDLFELYDEALVVALEQYARG